MLPEVELPGHATAAINAMRMRYRNNPAAGKFVFLRFVSRLKKVILINICNM